MLAFGRYDKPAGCPSVGFPRLSNSRHTGLIIEKVPGVGNMGGSRDGLRESRLSRRRMGLL